MFVFTNGLFLLIFLCLQPKHVDFEEMSWYQDLAMYGYHGDKVDKEDDDLNLLPLVVEKILIPKLTGNLFMKWKIPGVLYKEWTCFQFIQYL